MHAEYKFMIDLLSYAKISACSTNIEQVMLTKYDCRHEYISNISKSICEKFFTTAFTCVLIRTDRLLFPPPSPTKVTVGVFFD